MGNRREGSELNGRGGGSSHGVPMWSDVEKYEGQTSSDCQADGYGNHHTETASAQLRSARNPGNVSGDVQTTTELIDH